MAGGLDPTMHLRIEPDPHAGGHRLIVDGQRIPGPIYGVTLYDDGHSGVPDIAFNMPPSAARDALALSRDQTRPVRLEIVLGTYPEPVKGSIYDPA